MTTKHTAGPWTVSKSPSHNGYRVTSSDVDTGLDVSVFAPYGRREKERQEQALADAHLIAAAPDLVEALKELAFRAERHGMNTDDALAAISKAEGV